MQPHELAPAGAGFGLRRLPRCRLSLMGKLLFGTFIIGVPAILIWSYAKGTRDRIPDDDRGDGPDRLQRLLLDAVRAGRLVADPVRRPQHRPQRVRAVHDLRAADAELQPDLHRAVRAADEHAVDGARQARPRAVDPGQVRDRADGRRRGLPVPRVRLDLRRAGTTSRSGCGGLRASTSSTRSPSCASRRSASA